MLNLQGVSQSFIFRVLPILIVLFFPVSEIYSQLTLTGEVRPRAEYRHGFKRLIAEDENAAFFVEQRSRIYLSYRKERVRFQFNLQDVRIWGNASQVYKTDPALQNVHEAWAELGITDAWSVKFGRQEIDYDDARFLGDLRWAQQSRSHDALLFKYEPGESDLKVHIAGAYNQHVPFEPSRLTGTFYRGVNNYKTMQYLRLEKTFGATNWSLLVHNDGRQLADTTMAYRQTAGTRLVHNFSRFKLNGELYYQTGEDEAGVDVSAYLLALSAGFKLGAVGLTVGGDFLSGTGADDDKSHAFAPLYGTNHKFYGYMDYFYVGNPHGQNGRTTGLTDLYVKSALPMGEKGKLHAHLHGFFSPVTVFDMGGQELDNYLGTELDLVYARSFLEGMVTFNLGYSQMLGTETLEAIKGGGDHTAWNSWIWTMVTVKPVLFSSEKEMDN